MRRSSGRGQFEAVVALVAVLAVSAGLVAYAETLATALPGEPERATAETALDRVHRTLRVAGVARPDRLHRAGDVAPDGWRLNVTLSTRRGRWTRGPAPPDEGLCAGRRISVRVAPGELRPGRLRVVLWR
ncbi:hypothetical protein BRD09_00625 [Halobacteriales archaeon SW_10_68_16]|jgi:hypothetical protein|nr:MAG: hypothetical protein BRD09_00625 [Halobacteriales archaeon SW_10_68_16]